MKNSVIEIFKVTFRPNLNQSSTTNLGPPPNAVGRDEHLAAAVLDPGGERLCAVAAEDDGVDGADARAGEHGDDELVDHWHVDGHALPLLDPLRLEHVGELADLLVQLRVRDLALVARVVALPEEGRLAAALLEVPVQAVVAQVGLGVPHPLHVDLALEGVGIKFELVNLQK